jgi:hypothetical protein
MKRALGGTKVKHYHGIDLSQPALERATKNLVGVRFEVELDHRDFVTALTRRPEPADAAWCGLSIHHLSTEGKLELLKAIHGSTSKFLMIYEPTLADGETRNQYTERFARVNRPAWTFLTPEEWAQIDHHVIPETIRRRAPSGMSSAARPASTATTVKTKQARYSAASLTYSPLPTGQAAHSSVSAAISLAISASVWTGEGVKRMRSVPRLTVG